MKRLYKNIAYETMYGEGCIVLDNDLIKQYIVESERLSESSQVQGVYSDEGLYDFFASFSDYKEVTKFKATKIIGWRVLNYMLDEKVADPFYDLGMTTNTDSSRADSVSYGGAVMAGEKNLKITDKKYMKEMEKIISQLGWDIIKWMGIGPDRQSQVVIIPSNEADKESGKLNEEVIMHVQFNEELSVPADILTSPVKKITEEDAKIKKVIAIYPGRFQPFGPHHKAQYKYLKKRFDNVYIATSNKSGGNRYPMSFNEKKRHMIKMGIPSSAIKMENQPYIPKGILNKEDGNTTAVIFGIGEKDQGRLSGGKYFKKYGQNYNSLKGFDHHGYTIKLPHTSISVAGIELSGTTIRKLLGSDKFDIKSKEKFFKSMFGYFNSKSFDQFTTAFKEEIKLDIEIGDTILVGKFKNKRMVVKDIGADKHGMPTVNGRKVTTFRYVKEPNAFKEQKELLLMGGAYGHMAHPFDDYGLTFGEMKDIIDLGLQGKLDKEESVTEKLDGQNIMISAIDGKARAARNKGDLKRGGMSLKAVKAKFSNHLPSVRDAFVFAVRDIALSIEKMSKKDQDALFANGKNWANIEIIYPENKNVIDYDGAATIVFHGILKYNEAWIPSGMVKSGGSRLSTIINTVNKGIKTKFAFKGPNVLKMHKVKNYTATKSKYTSSLSRLQNIYKLKDSDELSLWHQHYWLEYILAGANSTDFMNITDNVLYPLMKRWAFSDKSYKMTEINKLKEDHPEFVDWVRSTEKMDHVNMLKANMRPFEEIFFGVGAEILANASNFLSVSPDLTVQKLRSDLDKASKAIKAKKDFSNLSKLQTQLRKLKAMPDISTAAPTEGLVFKYNGKVYKFTGFFAPINQIIGLQKFSR